ncbi:MAG TPA: SHOCT domain-containing protein [Burkholderiales bacterium]|nr:SHOCT domain-containing protein [Burkholderiales bacterium]
MVKRSTVWVAALAMSAMLAACGGEEVHIKASTATTGQQLTDLQKAYEAGAISKEEYERERKKMLAK